MSDCGGKVALITGVAGGIGAAIAGRLAEEGAKVIDDDVRIDAARSIARTARPVRYRR